MPKVRAYLSPRGNRIEIAYPESDAHLEAARKIPGRSFIKKGVHGPGIRFPLDSQTARLLRQAFRSDLELAPDLRAWGEETMSRERNMAALSLADTAKLRRLPRLLPEVAKMLEDRPYQSADIAFMAAANSLNGNQTGMGKTLETIAAAFEAGLGKGPHLVVAPTTSLVNTWQEELERLQPYPVLTGETPEERKQAVRRAWRLYRQGRPFWLCINPEMVRYRRDKKSPVIMERGKAVHPLMAPFPTLFETEWNTVTVDEAHKTGAANPKSLAHRALADLVAQRLYFLTATPMGGKPERLWGFLHLLEPETYGALWAWVERWFEIIEMDLELVDGDRRIREVSQVKPDLKEDFAKALQPHMIRRLRRDHMKDLPQEEHFDIWCTMTQKQRSQYLQFAAAAEIRIEEERLSATGVLAEYARLKQFANAACRVEKYSKYNKQTNEHEDKLLVFPTPDSGKLEFLLDRLDENGIRKDDPEPAARALVGSESKRMVDMVADYLNAHGIVAERIHGGVKGPDRTEAIRRFKRGEVQVLVLATTAGGVSLNLEEAGSVHILDETWNPDDQEQLWGRGDRGTRTEPLLVYWYRTKDSIQEYIHQVADGKAITNRNILDVRREMLGLLPRA